MCRVAWFNLVSMAGSRNGSASSAIPCGSFKSSRAESRFLSLVRKVEDIRGVAGTGVSGISMALLVMQMRSLR